MPGVRILQLDLAALEALAAGDLASANAHSPVPLSDFFVGPFEHRHLAALEPCRSPGTPRRRGG